MAYKFNVGQKVVINLAYSAYRSNRARIVAQSAERNPPELNIYAVEMLGSGARVSFLERNLVAIDSTVPDDRHLEEI